MKRGSNDQTILEVLREWLANHPARQRYHQSLIQDTWRTKMGPVIDAQTEYVRFKEGVVLIRIRSAALKQELFMGSAKLLALLQEAHPDAGIREVRVQ